MALRTTANSPGLAALFGSNPYSVGALVTNPKSSVKEVKNAGPYKTQAFDANKNAEQSTFTSTAPAAPAAPVIDKKQLAQFDQAISVLDNSLGRLPNQLGIAKANVNDTYQQGQNELVSGKKQARNTYDTSTTQNNQSYRTDKNSIADTASSGLRSLQRLLGAYGAGGSSEARYVAPEAVATQASQERAGAGTTFAQNQLGLDTNWNNFMTDYENSEEKLKDWRTQQLRSAESQSLSTKQNLLSKLADLKGKRAQAAGGDYTGGAQPFVDQSNALSGKIDALARFKPTYDGTTPTYQASELDNYIANAGGAPGVSRSVNDDATPYLAMLLGNNDKDKRLV